MSVIKKPPPPPPHDNKDAKLRKKIMARWRRQMELEAQPLSIGLVALFVSSYCNQAVPRVMGSLISQKQSSSSRGSNSAMSALMTTTTTSTRDSNDDILRNILLVSLVGGCASFVRTTMLNRAKDNIAARLRSETFADLMTKRELEWYQNGQEQEDGAEKSEENSSKETKSEPPQVSSTGVSPSTVSWVLKEDVETVSHTLTATGANLARYLFSCCFGAYHMMRLNPSLVGLSLCAAPIVGAIGLKTRSFLKKVVAKQEEAAMAATSFLEERLHHFAMVQLSNRADSEVRMFQKLQEQQVAYGRKSSFANGLSMGTIFSISTSTLFGVLYVGGKSVTEGRMDHGELVSFGMYASLLALNSASIISALKDISKGITAAMRLHRLVEDDDDENTSDSDSDSAKSVGAPLVSVDVHKVQSMRMQNVSFSYKSDPSGNTLTNVSLELKRGEVVVLVGKNGSGKSTIASLLAGLYPRISGNILVEEDHEEQRRFVDFLHELDRETQSNLIQLVPQTPALFDTSILENVRYARPTATEAEVRAVLSAAGCDEFVSKLELGLHSPVGRHGSRLSGGQRQRLGLARALLADPAVLILDEPASALDAAGAAMVADLCKQSNRALLLITHAVANLTLADSIVVLQDGIVQERGTMQELMADPNAALKELLPELGEQ